MVCETEGLGVPLQHRLSAQRWADGINMWINSMLTFNHPLGVQIVCLGYLWILRIVDKNWNHDLRDKLLHTKPNTQIDVISWSHFNITCVLKRVIRLAAVLIERHLQCFQNRWLIYNNDFHTPFISSKRSYDTLGEGVWVLLKKMV